MFTFILTSLFGAGLGLTIKEVIEPLKRIKLVLLVLIANFLLIPAIAYALSVLLKVDPGLHAGLIIIACCAGAPFLPKLITTAKGNVAYSIGIMVLLMAVTVVFLPIALPLIIPGLSVNPLGIAKPLVLFMLLPLGLGLLVKAGISNLAALIKPFIMKISSFSLIIAGIFALLADYKIFTAAWGTGVYNAMALLTILALLIGYIFGLISQSEKSVMTLGSGARNIAAALIIAATNFSDPRVTTVVLIGSLVQFIILFLLAFCLGKYAPAR
jgi:BASS family bile acid:Na+ symporter